MRHVIPAALAALLVPGCSTYPAWLASSGPSAARIEAGDGAAVAEARIQVVDMTARVARSLQDGQKRLLFSEVLGSGPAPTFSVGRGDVLEVSIWEAPPALLFGAALGSGTGLPSARAAAFPEQMVTDQGTISVPFAGTVSVAGKSPQDIEAEISERLRGKANQPQALVRVVRNTSSNVTVVGEVNTSVRLPLTPRGERLLDALAAAGGVRQPIPKVSIQVTRGDKVVSLPLETVIQDPRQNIPLHSGDVVSLLHQPFSFNVLGATGRNEEVNFEAQGISLAQALARVGGLQDTRADATGVFIFRLEDPAVLASERRQPTTPDGRVPVVYRIDLRNPATFFIAQSFPMRNRDVMYVANASAAELQKFLNVLVSVVYPIDNIIRSTR